MLKIGVAYSGIIWQKLWTSLGPEVELIDVCKLHSLELNDFDIFICPQHTNQEVLNEMEKERKLTSFLKNGNVLILFGECFTNWMPACHWNEGFDETITIADAQHPILKGLTGDSLSNWYASAHGYFSHVSKDARILLKGGSEDRIVMFLDEEKTFTRGVLIASTLDPDLHWYAGSKHAGRGDPRHNAPGAETLLNNIIVWAKYKALDLRDRYPKDKSLASSRQFSQQNQSMRVKINGNPSGNITISQGNENTITIRQQISDAFKEAYNTVESKALTDQQKGEIRKYLGDLKQELLKGKDADAGKIQKALKWLKEHASDIALIVADVTLNVLRVICGI